MESIVNIIMESGRSAVDLALYTLLPIMVAMMMLMAVLEVTKILPTIERWLTRPLKLVGLPAQGIIAAVQLLFVNFAAPLACLTTMNKDPEKIPRCQLAATLALVLTMAQANVTFPLLADGLSLWIIPVSVIGGIAASASTYYCFARLVGAQEIDDAQSADDPDEDGDKDVMTKLLDAGVEGVMTALKATPFLLVGLGLMNTLRAVGAAALLETTLSPIVGSLRLPDAASLPIITKFLAGGTAMMGVAHNLIDEAALSSLDLNRMAGFTIHPCDLVGVPMLMTAGKRVRAVILPALLGTAVGVLVRASLHLILF